MIESPLLDELINEAKAMGIQDDILEALEARLGAVPPAVATALRGLQDEERLRQLHRWSVQCPDLAAFQARLISGVTGHSETDRRARHFGPSSP